MKTLKSSFTSLCLCLDCQHRISCFLMKYNSSGCDWLFPPSAREVSPGNRSNYKSTRERVDSKGLYGRWRLHLMGSWLLLSFCLINFFFMKITFIFSCSGLFRDVPACSGMFRNVPCSWFYRRPI